MSQRTTKVSIIGAGLVGASAAYTLALTRTAREIVLIDVNKDKAKGEALDINHGLCHMEQMNIYAGDYADCANCDAIVVTAGFNRKPGETRLDLAAKNIPNAREITQNIMKYYNGGVILVVANPADILTYLIQKWSGLPASSVIGTGTALDSARLRFYIADMLKVDIQNVHGYVIGEHGDSQVTLWSALQIAGQSLDEYCSAMGISLSKEDMSEIERKTRSGGADVIKLKGATYYAISGIIQNTLESILKNKNSIKTVASVINGPYGVHDVAISLPTLIDKNGAQHIIPYKLTPEEQDAFSKSVQALKAFLDQVKAL